jgi:pimeloyl-ACP methyl ester carboxylesterase
VSEPFDPAAPFYAWSEDLSGTARGTLLRSEPLSERELIRGAARGWRVLYVSLGSTGAKVAVSGLVLLPKAEAPEGGWAVVSYAVGTTGITAIAAPSLDPHATVLGYPAWTTIPSFLQAEYAVVLSDQEGRGTAGPHPYLHGPMLAANQIDAVRAGRELTSELSPIWVAMGASEGGQSTLFAAAVATATAPELDYRGAVAECAPVEWSTLVGDMTDTARILLPLVLHAYTYHDPSIKVEEHLNDDGLALWKAWCTSRLAEPGEVLDTFMPMLGKPLFRFAPGETSHAEAAARVFADIDLSALEASRGRFDRPVLLTEGAVDEYCVPGTVRRYAEDLRAAGSDVEYHCYDANHMDLPYRSLADTLPFVRRITGRMPLESLLEGNWGRGVNAGDDERPHNGASLAVR